MEQSTVSRTMVCLGALIVAACTGTLGGNGQGGGGNGGDVVEQSSSSVSSSSGQGGAGNAGSSSSSGSGPGSSSSSASSSSSSSGSSGDPYDAARQTCIDKINALRATKGLPAYGRWKDAELCVDQQATHDEMINKPHDAFSKGLYPTCNGFGQNECLGQGVAGIEGCLDQMWDERLQAGCAGCDACADAYDPNCPNCDFYGSKTGDVCGHYINMSAKYFSMAACGFSSLGGWDAINFQ